MLTYEDCLGVSGLTAGEIEAIAEHEHLPSMLAVEYGRYVLEDENGAKRLKRIILDDIDLARLRGDTLHAACLKLILRDFCRRFEAQTG
jgi:hypothetical protein